METRKLNGYPADGQVVPYPLAPAPSLEVVRKVETEFLLEELAAVIESEDGLLIP